VFNLQGSEIVVILLLALVILGPEKLPDAIRRFTQTYAELKKMGSGFQSELKNALDEPMREMRETGDRLREAVDPARYVVTPPAETAQPVAEPGAESVAEPVAESVAEPGAESVAEPAADRPVDTPVDTAGGDPVVEEPSPNGSLDEPADPGSTTVATPGDPPAR
jgi:sec-independent protein translocase protein TatB